MTPFTKTLILVVSLYFSFCLTANAQEFVNLKEILPEYMSGDLESAIYPIPQLETLEEQTRRIDHLSVMGLQTAPVKIKTHLNELGKKFNMGIARNSDCRLIIGEKALLSLDIPEKKLILTQVDLIKSRGDEAYLIVSKSLEREDFNHLIFIAANHPQAYLWAFATLEQMIFMHKGKAHVRLGKVIDYPAFKFRGNKRPKSWEWRYKANYAWRYLPSKFYPKEKFNNDDMQALSRNPGAWIYHGEYLAATDTEMDQLMTKGGKYVRGSAIEYYKEGCREFVLKFDDSHWYLTEATKKKFSPSGVSRDIYRRDYYKALHAFIHGMVKRIKNLDPENRIYFQPRTYSYHIPEHQVFLDNLLKHGPLPKALRLSVCGPEVISRHISTACMREYRERYGLVLPSQIYDNYGRGGDLFAYQGRSKDLWKEVDCLFLERGTPVIRMTALDYLWNPENYDPERSLKLAIRELSSRKPAVYHRLKHFIDLYNESRSPHGYAQSRESYLNLRLDQNRKLLSSWNYLKSVLHHSPLARELDLEKEIWGKSDPQNTYEWGEYARLGRRLAFEPFVQEFGYREIAVVPTRDEIKIDGKLDEKIWKNQSGMTLAKAFLGSKHLPKEYAEPHALDSENRIYAAYNATHLYLAMSIYSDKKIKVGKTLQHIWQGKKEYERANFTWRAPSVEFFFDSEGKRDAYTQIISNVSHLWSSVKCQRFEKDRSGPWWKPDWKFRFHFKDDRRGSFEARIPLRDLSGTIPGKGSVWGFQVFRNRLGPFRVFSGIYDLVGGEHGTREFGRMMFL